MCFLEIRRRNHALFPAEPEGPLPAVMEEEDFEPGYKYDDEDLYQRLGVSREATVEDIHAAYRRESRTWHPDKNEAKNRDVAERKFKQLTEAHNILSDPTRREIYNKLGYAAAAAVSDRELAHYTSFEEVLSDE